MSTRVCRCAEPGRTEDEMYQCEADDCLAHDWLAIGGGPSGDYMTAADRDRFPAMDHPSALQQVMSEFRACAANLRKEDR